AVLAGAGRLGLRDDGAEARIEAALVGADGGRRGDRPRGAAIVGDGEGGGRGGGLRLGFGLRRAGGEVEQVGQTELAQKDPLASERGLVDAPFPRPDRFAGDAEACWDGEAARAATVGTGEEAVDAQLLERIAAILRETRGPLVHACGERAGGRVTG